MDCCSNHKNKDSNPEKNDLNRDGNDSHHGDHGNMMWLMMLLCLAPLVLVYLTGGRIGTGFIFFILLACVGGHFILMKFMGHKK
jgi:Flp pilus assembly protein TadB